jgi:hypothetical protein
MHRLGSVLTWAGLGVWSAGIVAWVLGVWTTLPPDTVRAIVLSLAALSGGFLLVAGAGVSRAAKGRRIEESRVLKVEAQRELVNPAATGANVSTSQPQDRRAVTDARVT